MMTLNKELREKLNSLTCIEVDFKGLTSSKLGALCQKTISDGVDDAFSAELKFLALTPNKRGQARVTATTIPKATVDLLPLRFERAGEVAGHVSILAKITSITWKAGGVKPDDTLPHAVKDLPKLDFDKINLFDGTAFGEGTAIRILYDAKRLDTDDEARGYVDMVTAGAEFAADTIGFQPYVPEDSGLRSENGFFPYFGKLVTVQAGKVDLKALASLDMNLIEEALKLCETEQNACGDYTATMRSALSQNPHYLALFQGEQPSNQPNGQSGSQQDS